jgi:hypothetical protein
LHTSFGDVLVEGFGMVKQPLVALILQKMLAAVAQCGVFPGIEPPQLRPGGKGFFLCVDSNSLK